MLLPFLSKGGDTRCAAACGCGAERGLARDAAACGCAACVLTLKASSSYILFVALNSGDLKPLKEVSTFMEFSTAPISVNDANAPGITITVLLACMGQL